MRSRVLLLFGFAILIGLIVTVSAGILARPYTYQGSLIDPPVKAADFSLVDQNGQPFRLSDQEGKVVLIFFGYTHCPDVCPVTLTRYKQLRAELGDQAGQVRFVFITVDPERDNVENLQKFLVNYDPAITGLTGSRAELDQVLNSYGVYEGKAQIESADDYLVDHTARVYAIDAQGNWRLTYPFEMDTPAILDDVRQLLKSET
jgi:protein SCO1/2